MLILASLVRPWVAYRANFCAQFDRSCVQKMPFPAAANAGMARKFLLPQRSGADGAKIPATRRRAVAQTRRIPGGRAHQHPRSVAVRQWIDVV
jgi:hypothetical protein